MVSLDNENATLDLVTVFPVHFRVNFTSFDKNFNIKFDKLASTSKAQTAGNIYVIDAVTGTPKKFHLLNEDVIKFFLI